MTEIKKIAVSVFLALMSLNINAQTNEPYNWEPVMEAIIKVESGGNPNAKNKGCIGAMQISPVLVKECNNILKKRNLTKRYTLADRYSIAKSKEMFVLIQSEFNKNNSVERAIKGWNGGVHYKPSKSLQRYYQKVLRHIKK